MGRVWEILKLCINALGIRHFIHGNVWWSLRQNINEKCDYSIHEKKSSPITQQFREKNRERYLIISQKKIINDTKTSNKIYHQRYYKNEGKM